VSKVSEKQREAAKSVRRAFGVDEDQAAESDNKPSLMMRIKDKLAEKLGGPGLAENVTKSLEKRKRGDK
jgi:hypothetical protein